MALRMFLFLYLFAIYSGLILIRQTDAGSSNRQFTGLRRNGFKLKVNYINEQRYTGGIIECSSQCTSLTSCRSISWNDQQRLCLMSSSDVTHDKKADQTLEQDVLWKTMSMMEYTVFLAMNSSLTSIMQYNQAEELCVMRHTVIAGRSDMLYSRSLGFSYYKCAWLSDRTIGFVIQSIQGVSSCNINSHPWAVCILN